MLTTAPIPFEVRIRVPIDFQYLTDTPYEQLPSIVESTLPKCRKDYGYRLGVSDIRPVGDVGIVHASGQACVTVDVTLSTILPKCGDVFHMCIVEIYKQGMYAEFADALRVFIPQEWMPDGMQLIVPLITTRTLLVYSSPDGDARQWTVGGWIYVELVHVEFLNRAYTMTGKMLLI